MKKNASLMLVTVLVIVLLAACSAPPPAAAPTQAPAAAAPTQAPAVKPLKVGFVGGIVHPFTSAVDNGIKDAAKALGVEVVSQMPESWEPSVQTPMIDAMLSKGDIDLLILIPTDKDAMIPVLERVNKAGIPVITVDTSIGDGIYEAGHPVTFPVSYIGSDNLEGGRIAGEALAKKLDYKGKVYVQSVTPGISTTDQRFQGFKEVISKYPNMSIVGVDYNDADAAKATSQTAAALQREPAIAGIFGTNDHSSIGAGLAVKNAGFQDKVTVIAFDATKAAIEGIQSDIIDMALAQKPYEMGYYSMLVGFAKMKGAPYAPIRIPTGYVVIDSSNYTDPQYSKWVY